MKVYTYENCGTCRKAMKLFAELGLNVTPIPIREKPPTVAELKAMLGNYEGDIRRLFNTSGRDYQSLNMKEKLPTMTEAEALKLLSQNGNLVKRPFLISRQRGLVGFEENAWREFLKSERL
jgi:arsenate reductase (glutaredoxin)